MSIDSRRKASSSGSKALGDSDLSSPRGHRPITPLVPAFLVPSPETSSRVDEPLPTPRLGPTEKTSFFFFITGRGNPGKTVCARMTDKFHSSKFAKPAKKEGL